MYYALNLALPVSDHTDSTSKKTCVDSWETYISNKRGGLLGITCFFSSKREGYLFSVYDNVHQLTTYPYTSELVQVRLFLN